MRKYLVFFILFSFFYNLNAQTVKLNAGVIFYNTLSSKKESLVGSEIWKKALMTKSKNLDANIFFYTNEDKLLKDYKSLKINIVIADLNFYYKNKKVMDSLTDNKFIINQSNDFYESYYLIKNNDSNIDLEKLNYNKIYYKNRVEKNWLEWYVLKNKLDKNILKRLTKVEKQKKLIYDVFFNKKDISLVPKSLYDSMVALNPQIKKELKIIKKSEPMFFQSCGFARDDKKNNFDKKFLVKMEEKVNQKKDFTNSLTYNSVSGVYIIKDDDYKEELTTFYKEYFSLKKQNGIE